MVGFKIREGKQMIGS